MVVLRDFQRESTPWAPSAQALPFALFLHLETARLSDELSQGDALPGRQHLALSLVDAG